MQRLIILKQGLQFKLLPQIADSKFFAYVKCLPRERAVLFKKVEDKAQNKG